MTNLADIPRLWIGALVVRALWDAKWPVLQGTFSVVVTVLLVAAWWRYPDHWWDGVLAVINALAVPPLLSTCRLRGKLFIVRQIKAAVDSHGSVLVYRWAVPWLSYDPWLGRWYPTAWVSGFVVTGVEIRVAPKEDEA